MPQRTLADEAANIANQLRARVSALETELRTIEERKRQIEAELRQAHLTSERLPRYRPKIMEERQCPKCWLRDESKVALSCLDGTDELDLYECPVCGFEWTEAESSN